MPGGTKLPECSVPGAVPVLNADFIRHSGQRPIGVSPFRVLPQFGQFVVATVVLHLLLRNPPAKVATQASGREHGEQMAQLVLDVVWRVNRSSHFFP